MKIALKGPKAAKSIACLHVHLLKCQTPSQRLCISLFLRIHMKQDRLSFLSSVKQALSEG